MEKLIPVDMTEPPGAETATEVPFPESFSKRAKKVLDYLDGTAFLFFYKGKYVLTDESLYLTPHGDGSADAPLGAPRWTGKTLLELEHWLEDTADFYDEDGNVPGWETAKEGGDLPESEPDHPTEVPDGGADRG